MKKIKKISILFLIMLLVVTTSCKGPVTKNTKTATVLVVGPHANSEPINYSSALIQNGVYDAIASYGNLAIITSEGEPQIMMNESCDIPSQYKKASPKLLQNNAMQATSNVLQSLPDIKVNSSEVNTLLAVQKASRVLSSMSEDTDKRIIIADTGLVNTGVLDFNNNLMAASPESIISELMERKEIPDLTGVDVYWQQLGDVAMPQETLSPAQREKLILIWKQIIEAGGGRFHLDDTPTTVNNNFVKQDLPTVTPIDLEKEPPLIIAEEKVEEETNIFEEGQAIFLLEERVGFYPDSDQFLDEKSVRSLIKPIAEYMISHESFRLLLIGTTAGDGISEYTLTLSKNRVDAVKRVLVELGVKEESICVIGMGSTDPWHISGVGTEGELAAQNRKVVVIDADSEMAQSILFETNN